VDLMVDLQDQMAGPQLPPDALQAAERWLTRLPPPPSGPVVAADAVERGRALFARADVGCADCHTGPLGTDGESHRVGDGTWQTPPLRGIALRPPYLHDGRAATLREVLGTGRDGEHGDTGGLSEAELGDLEAYVRSL
jgi:mono/diheme cytochrome c family protein